MFSELYLLWEDLIKILRYSFLFYQKKFGFIPWDLYLYFV